MNRFYKIMKRDNKGFTLVELMVVLLILGILVAIAIPVYNTTQANARMKACQANLRTIDGAIVQYAAENNKKPDDVTINTLVKNGYLKNPPKCPGGGNYTVESGVATCTVPEHKY